MQLSQPIVAYAQLTVTFLLLRLSLVSGSKSSIRAVAKPALGSGGGPRLEGRGAASVRPPNRIKIPPILL